MYRLVLYRDRKLVGRQEFEADDTTSALFIATAIFKGCGADCDSYELWDNAYRIDAPLTTSELTAQRQAQAIAAEESMLKGRWAIAKSVHLLARCNALKAARA